MASSITRALSSPLVSLVPFVTLLSAFLLALVAYVIRGAVRGRIRTERVMKQGGTVLLGEYFMEYGYWVFSPLSRALVRWKVHPDVLSWSSLVLHCVAALAIGGGFFGLGAWLLLFGAMCDALDGTVARARGVASDAGEVLDAAIDRVAEMVVFFGYAYYYRTEPLGFVLCALACVGAVMVSYARAKGEAMGIDAKMGLMQRHERAAYLVVATLFSSLLTYFWEPGTAEPRHYLVLAALGLIALLANLTGIQRIAFVRAELRKRGR
jgi:CDP-diacylglycerol--glycerol-3-phosphate 3-phosphatidyltransferase